MLTRSGAVSKGAPSEHQQSPYRGEVILGTIFFRCFVLKRGRGKPLRTHLHNPQPPDGESSRTHQIPLHSRPRAAIQQNPQAPLSKWLTPSDISRKNHRNHWRTSQMRTRQRDRSQEDGTSFGVDGICPGGGAKQQNTGRPCASADQALARTV